MESFYTGTVTRFTRTRSLPASHSVIHRRSRAFQNVLLLSLIHVPLGIIIYRWPTVGTIHQVCIFTLALYYAWQGQKIERVGIIVAYIIGAEVLWRMAGVSIYWELGKFVSAFIMIVALIRRRGHRVPLLPVLYFAVLIPACLITLVSKMPGDARNILSSNMSGPFFLFISSIFFANLTLTRAAIGRILIAALLPLFSVAFVTLFFTISIEEIQFTGESNFATSGGFGPNQVSSMLGLGAFLALLILVVYRKSLKLSMFLVLTALLMTAQSVMTFSRGGMYNAIGAIAATIFVLVLRNPSTAIRRLVPIMSAGVLFVALIFPALDNFTGGSLGERFEDTAGTNRTDIVMADLKIFLDRPFGAGVGIAYELREEYLGHKAMSHTEFTRLLAEHGVFGLLAIAILVSIAIANVHRQPITFGKALFVGMLVWSSLFMMNAGMRLAAPAFLWGMTFVTIANRDQIRIRRAGLRRSRENGQ